MKPSAAGPARKPRFTTKQKKQLLLLGGTAAMFFGVVLIISGMTSPAWSVGRYEMSVQKDGKNSIVLAHDPLQEKTTTTFIKLNSPWKECRELLLLSRDECYGYGRCKDIYIADYCKDDEFNGICTNNNVVVVFAHIGAMLGMVAVVLAASSTMTKGLYQQRTALTSAVVGLGSCIFVIIAVCVWFSLHGDAIESERDKLFGSKMFSNIKVGYKNDIKVLEMLVRSLSDGQDKKRLAFFRSVLNDLEKAKESWSYSLGYSFNLTGAGGALMALGAVMLVFGAINKGKMANDESEDPEGQGSTTKTAAKESKTQEEHIEEKGEEEEEKSAEKTDKKASGIPLFEKAKKSMGM